MRRARLSTLLFFLGAQTVFAGSLVHVGKLAMERFGASGGTADVIVYDPATFEIVETRALERPLTDHAAVLLPEWHGAAARRRHRVRREA